LFLIKEPCQFPLVFGRRLKTLPIRMINLKSGNLLLPTGDDWFDGLFASIAKSYPNRPVLKVERVPNPGPLSDYLRSSARIRARYFLQEIPGQTRVQTIHLPSTYESFLATYGAKKRYNLRRQRRLLQDHTAGKLAMSRCDSIRDFPEFMSDHVKLRQMRGHIADVAHFDRRFPGFRAYHWQLARMGLLRSYILKDAERPIACIVGYHYGEIFLIGKIDHDPAYAEFSPGATLLQMVIEDLIKDGRVKLINMGHCASANSHRATNEVLDFVSYWLIPKTWSSRVFLASYAAFRRVVALLKYAMRLRKQEQPAQLP
jgi:hypothetical protein